MMIINTIVDPIVLIHCIVLILLLRTPNRNRTLVIILTAARTICRYTRND